MGDGTIDANMPVQVLFEGLARGLCDATIVARLTQHLSSYHGIFSCRELKALSKILVVEAIAKASFGPGFVKQLQRSLFIPPADFDDPVQKKLTASRGKGTLNETSYKKENTLLKTHATALCGGADEMQKHFNLPRQTIARIAAIMADS